MKTASSRLMKQNLLFALNDACKAYHHEWPEFLIEAITDYIVFQEAPRGYLTAANATG